MDFATPTSVSTDLLRLREFIKTAILPELATWSRKRELPSSLFGQIGEGGWYGVEFTDGRLSRGSALRESMIAEELAHPDPDSVIEFGGGLLDDLRQRNVILGTRA